MVTGAVLITAVVQGSISACAGRLAATIFAAQIDALARRINDPQKNALEKVYKRAFEAMLRAAATAIAEKEGEVSKADIGTIEEVLTKFCQQKGVREAFLAVALDSTKLDMTVMEEYWSLRSVRGPDLPQSIHFRFERAVGVFQDVLTFQLDQEAARNKELFSWWTVGAIRAVLLKEHEILALLQGQGATLERIERKVDQLVQPPPPLPKHPPLERIERVTPFVSREDEQADLLEKLQPGAVVSVCGTGGMGKSALTAEVIHQLASRALPRERPSENASPMASSSIPFMARGAAARSTPSSTF